VVYDIDLAGQDQGASGLGYRSSSGLLQLYYLDHIMRLGQLTAVERMGHFLLEVELRLRRAGLSIGGRFELPITQEALADYLGLSPVHVNRVLQKLRRDNLVEREGHTHIIKDFKRLAEESHFKLSDLPANV
jgi:CRP-like cAMP-binding protein